MTKLLTLMILLTACGSVEDGAVSVSVKDTPAPTTPEEETIPALNDEIDGEETETTANSVNEEEAVVESPTPTPSPSTLDMELIGQKKEVFDNLIQTRIDNLLTWDLGQDYSAKEDRTDSSFTEAKDYSGFFSEEAYNLTFATDFRSSVGNYQKRICGEVEYSTLSFSESWIIYRDSTSAKIRIEIAFDETNFVASGDPLPIKYIRLWLKKSDAEELSWTNSQCN